MALIDAELEDAAVLQAEDEAILAALQPPTERPLPVGSTLADLIESLTNGTPEGLEVPPEDRQG